MKPEMKKALTEAFQAQSTKLREEGVIGSFIVTDRIERLIIDWGDKRKLFSESAPLVQMEKLREELEELQDALEFFQTFDPVKAAAGDEEHDAAIHNIADAIGDMAVVLTMIAAQLGMSFEYCKTEAYSQIADRKGVTKDGIFIKESDLQARGEA